MAGFLGIGNYEKEGPGIDKNAPQKHTFVVFFETFFRNFWKFISINFIYFIISVPLITNGLANAGITNVARNTARDKHSFGLPDFYETIKKNYKQALPVGIISIIVYALSILSIGFYYVSGTKYTAPIGMGVSFAVLLIFSMMQYYIWTLMITFNFKIGQLFMNSFRFVFVNLWKNLLCLLINVLIFALNYFILLLTPDKFSVGALGIEIVLFILIYPCFNALLIQYCTFPAIKKFIIDPYYKEHPDADIEKRRDLGLEIPENEREEKEDYFDQYVKEANTPDDTEPDDDTPIFED